MKTPNPNQTAKQELIKNDVPEHLHKLVTGLIVCITTDYDYRYEKAKEICDYENVWYDLQHDFVENEANRSTYFYRQ